MTAENTLTDDALLHGVRVATWRQLGDLAIQFRKLAPWTWMAEEDIFGIRLPGSDQIGFVSIMGAIGQHLACAVYLGWEALRDLRHALAGGELSFRSFIETPQLQLSFENREVLLANERDLLKQLGRSCRGRQAWPVFRSHRVGYLPWLVDQREADWLVHVVHQAIGVALRKEDHPTMLASPDAESVWVRGLGADGNWSEMWLHPPPPPPALPPPVLDAAKLERLRRKGAGNGCVQVDLPLSRAMIGQRGERPQTAYMLMVLDRESGYCLGAELIQALEGLPAMWRDVPGRLLDYFVNEGRFPNEIEVASEQMMAALRPLGERLPLKLTRRARLDRVTEMRASLDQFFGRDDGGDDERDPRL